jgi:hypothetical protein
VSFVFIPEQDGAFPPVPAEDRDGNPHDFSESAHLDGATVVALTGQGQHDPALLTAHLGILNSPDTWKAAFDFLTAPTTPSSTSGHSSTSDVPGGVQKSSVGGVETTRLAATGGATGPLLAGCAVLIVALAIRRRRRTRHA